MKTVQVRVGLVCLFLIFDTATASQPDYFRDITIKSKAALQLQVHLGRSTIQIDEVTIEILEHSGIVIDGKTTIPAKALPTTVVFDYKRHEDMAAYVRLRMTPIKEGRNYPPLYRCIYMMPYNGAESLLVPAAEIQDSVHNSLFPSSSSPSQLSKTDTASILQSMKSRAHRVARVTHDSQQIIQSVSGEGTISVAGYWKYTDNRGLDVPVVHAIVKVWDSEPSILPDDLLATGYTNIDGYYYFGGIDNDDGPFQGGLDIYVEVLCKYGKINDKGVFVSDGNILNKSYYAETEVLENVDDGLVSIGTYTITENTGAWGIYSSAIAAFDFFKDSSPSFLTKMIEVIWPHQSGPEFSHNYRIHVPEGWEWDKYALAHEYAHATMFKIYNDAMPSPAGSYLSHWLGMESDAGFALIEGWAEFAGRYITQDDWFESTTYADSTDDDDVDGAIVEGAVAEVLHDITDDSNDDGVPLKFGNLMTILMDDNPNQIADVKNQWKLHLYQYQDELQAIYFKQLIDPLSTDVSENPDTSLPSTFVLNQNYPNPFNPETKIEFSLPRASQVRIDIYNMLGQQVKNLVNERLSAGNKSVTWNGNDDFGRQVTSGVYFYKIVADKFVESKKMILIR